MRRVVLPGTSCAPRPSAMQRRRHALRRLGEPRGRVAHARSAWPTTADAGIRERRVTFDPKRTYDSVSGLEREGYRLVRTRISTNAPTATAYFSMVVNVGRVHIPLSRRETTLFVVHILTATSSCVIPAAVRAATRSATSICNVRSDLNVRARRFLRPRSSGSDARFLART